MENCEYEPLFRDAPPPPPSRGVGLFCQAITGADGLHGTDMGTKNKKKMQMAFLESARRLGSAKWSFALSFDDNELPKFVPKIKALDTRAQRTVHPPRLLALASSNRSSNALHTPPPPVQRKNKITKKCGPNKTVCWTHQSVPN